jgi:hypothetical protein
MSGPFGSSPWGYNPSTSFYDYTIDQSLRFNDNDSAYLTRTPASSGNLTTWTWSGWVKRCNLTNSALFSANYNSNQIVFSSDRLYFEHNDGSANNYKISTDKLRDTNAWYHLVFVWDTSNATAADRMRMYINSRRVTNFDSSSNPSLNRSSKFNTAIAHEIGHRINPSGFYLDAYLAEVHFVDGTALDPTSFGETSNGVWVPKEYTGSHGTNGFYLSFADSSAIGDDLSGNTNDFTANNLAATDVVSDSPTNSFCTLNPLTHGTYPTLKEGNLSIATAYSADLCGVTSTWYPTTGKWYWEIHAEGSTLTYPYFGITDQRYTNYSATAGSYYNIAWNRTGSAVSLSGYMGTITKENATSWTNDDIIMFALDVDARKLWIGKNGTWNDSGDPAAGTGENASWTVDTAVSPLWMGYQSQGVGSVFNFGQDGTFNGNQTAQGNSDDNGVGDFYYSPPTGFLAMATSNIAEPAIGPNSTEQADDNFNTVLYTGNGSTSHGITGVGFQPDWVWIKNRTDVVDHAIYDAVRGATKRLESNSTDAEVTQTEDLQSFDADGFTVGNQNRVNGSSDAMVSWNWKAGGSASSNSDGSITSNVSANTTALFSVGTYTGNATAGATIGHGLGEIPEVVIVKRRDNTRDWAVYHKDQSATPTNAYLLLNSTAAIGTGDTAWDNGTFTTDVFTIHDHELVNASGDSYVFYAFKGIEGYSKFGKYIGNGNANGPFVFTGFRPAWVMIKNTADITHWALWDTKRNTYNVSTTALYPSSTDGDQTGTALYVDFLSNGFKWRASHNSVNGSNDTFIYLAFAEAPFKYANAR